MLNSKIIGTGSYLPSRIVTNHDLAQTVDTTDEWIFARTGIKQRHVVASDETSADLAEKAALSAIKSAGINNNDIDLIIVATTTPDKIFPSTACLLQHRLDINNHSAAFDVQAVCTGFVYALSIADKFIKAGGVNNVLVVGAETMSKIINWQDRNTCILFGDGAGAVVLQATEVANTNSKIGILSTHLHSDGKHSELLHVPGGVSKIMPLATDNNIHMSGNEVFKIAVNTLGRIADETLTHNQINKSDIDWLVPHQANVRIIKATAKKLKLPMRKVILTVDLHGNTSSASVPLALDIAVRDGRIKPNNLILLEAFGGGFTWGSALIKM